MTTTSLTAMIELLERKEAIAKTALKQIAGDTQHHRQQIATYALVEMAQLEEQQ